MTAHNTPHDHGADTGHDDFGGLDRDRRLFGRRTMLGVIAGAGASVLVGACSRDNSSASGSTAAGAGDLEDIPQETAGPYPADGSNGPNVLTESGVVRQDIRPSFGSATGTAEGIESTIDLTITDSSTGDPLSGAAVYLWHCDRDGNYSLYSQGLENVNYLRGVQETADDGTLSFTSIYPACYSGRWPHIHFEVYESLDAATSGSEALATSQIALPDDVCAAVYATSGYEQSARNMSQLSLDSDNVFSDGWETQLATVTGDPGSGYAISLKLVLDPDEERAATAGAPGGGRG
jgi:protocatechuate 3,4-dioxygenase beta subunit